MTIAEWQATTKRVANGAINNQPLHKEEEDLVTAAPEGEAGGAEPRRPAGGPPGGGTGEDCLAMTSLACRTMPVASKSKTTTMVALTIAGWQATTTRAADGAINNQPLREEEEDHTSWLTPAFLVTPKMTTRKIWKVYCLFYILSVFSSSHPPILHPLSFFILSIHNNIISS